MNDEYKIPQPEDGASELREPAVAYCPGRRAVIEPWFDSDINPDAEALEDEYLLALALERERNDTGVTYTFAEVLAKDGLTFADLEAMEDVEIE
jgi:hypothetical protein